MLWKRLALPPATRQLLSGQETSSKGQVHGWIKSVRRQKMLHLQSSTMVAQRVFLSPTPLLADNGVLGWPTVRAFACLVHS